MVLFELIQHKSWRHDGSERTSQSKRRIKYASQSVASVGTATRRLKTPFYFDVLSDCYLINLLTSTLDTEYKPVQISGQCGS